MSAIRDYNCLLCEEKLGTLDERDDYDHNLWRRAYMNEAHRPDCPSGRARDPLYPLIA
jgi:hypothetical protein